MTDSLIDKYAKRGAPADVSRPGSEVGDEEDLGCFGWLRGVRDRAIMLELRRKDGHVLAVGYAWIERIELDPEKGITLHLPGRSITITGSGLNKDARPTVRLFDGLIRHRVPWVREADRAEMLRSDGVVCVASIRWDA